LICADSPTRNGLQQQQQSGAFSSSEGIPFAERFFRKLTIALVLFPLGTTRFPAYYNSLHTFPFELGLP
jgi:hypothetical protein